MSAKERIAPAVKAVSPSPSLKDGGHSKLTTPKKDTGGRVWAGAKQTNKIMK